jgi:Domain of unknown function (DUF1998)
MPDHKIRLSQVITTFSPGAMVDLPEDSVIIGGLDGWEYDRNEPEPIIREPRLAQRICAILQTRNIVLKRPPVSADKGFETFHPNVQCYRFPGWFVVQRAEPTASGFRRRRLVPGSALEKGKFKYDDGRREKVVPMRFVRSCKKGHVDDIDWMFFAHRGEEKNCPYKTLWVEERGTSGDIGNIYIACSCGKSESLAAAANPRASILGKCSGTRPWLGELAREECSENSRLLIRTASNAHFPQTLSAISIPEVISPVQESVKRHWTVLCDVGNLEDLKAARRFNPELKTAFQRLSDEEVWATIEETRSGSESDDRKLKDVEFETLCSSKEEIGENKPDGDFYARALPKVDWGAPWMAGIERVVLVHRLREVVALLGFTRIEPATKDVSGELDIGVERADIARDISWLPAFENRGEGVFLQFNEQALRDWMARPTVTKRAMMLLEGYKKWAGGEARKLEKFPGPVYYMLHSFSHLVLTAISLECGYPASSLRERIFVSMEPGEVCGGILIYTGSSDAEGTLGGLVQAGREIRRHVRIALEAGKLCSNDPVCSHHEYSMHDEQPLNGAACHGCLLISETSCEQHNVFLDRSLVVETVGYAGAEFFPDA